MSRLPSSPSASCLSLSSSITFAVPRQPGAVLVFNDQTQVEPNKWHRALYNVGFRHCSSRLSSLIDNLCIRFDHWRHVFVCALHDQGDQVSLQYYDSIALVFLLLLDTCPSNLLRVTFWAPNWPVLDGMLRLELYRRYKILRKYWLGNRSTASTRHDDWKDS